jgi:Predicted nucleic acid-binding protein, contains PIN domain
LSWRAARSAKAAALERWLNTVRHMFGRRILPIDQAVADAWGRLNASQPRPTVDSLLAATAQVYDLTLVTRNLTDMPKTGIAMLNPFVHP